LAKRFKDDDPIKGLRVEVRNGDINGALRRFKKKVQEDGILQELRNKEYYEKPSIVNARKRKQARARHLKALEKRNRDFGG
jgi:small subunit ribosomal protein S21